MTIPPLDHGAIGNGRVLALVSPSSAIDWLCMPRFDSPSVFGRLIDAEQGGTFRVLGRKGELKGDLAYLRNTNVLCSRFEQEDGIWEVVDFAPRIPAGLAVRTPASIVRIVRPVRGSPQLRIDFDPRPEYARAAPKFWERDRNIDVEWPGGRMSLQTSLPLSYVLRSQPFVLERQHWFVLSWGGPEGEWSMGSVQEQLDETIAGWRAWAKTCALPLFARDLVLRSALCLKLHIFEDTGAIIAAATTSIPEAMGTPRTWDYRYCWLRDSAFVIEALRRLSHLAEGERFLRFLRDVAESGPLQPVYAIDGGRDLTEITLPYLAGFGGTGPVRIGNAAAIQRQNDLCGELILSIDALLGDPRVEPSTADGIYPLVQRLVSEAISIAPTLDTGIWEFRTLMRNYTFSRVMCWAAVTRGAQIAERLGHPEDAARWRAIGEDERGVLLGRAYNPRLGYFTQALDGTFPDASNLLLPTIGLLPASDPRFQSTLLAYEELLVSDGLLLRYRNEDDFGETTSAFTICSFWWAEALALAGRLDEAVEVFQRVAAHANPVGLFSEDVDPPTGALLGNFPQAYTHVGAIHAAVTIGQYLDAREGRVRAWGV